MLLWGGANTDYRHESNVSYTVPFNKFPLTKWITANARYTGTYNWQRAPFAADSLGHTIQNSNNIQLNSTLNFRNLYNQIKYFKKIDQKFRKKQSKKRKTRLARKMERVLKADTASSDSTKKKKKEKDPDRILPHEHVIKMIMGIKNASVTYNQTNGLLLPGFKEENNILGLDGSFNSPGWPFIFGAQEFVGDARGQKFAPYAAENNWLVEGVNITTQHTISHSETMNGRMSLEPIKYFRVDISANSQYSRNSTEFFNWNDSLGGYESQAFIETGSYSKSFNTILTSFVSDQDNNVSPTFEKFLENRENISLRLAQERQNDLSNYVANTHETDTFGSFYEGYGANAQEVLIPAFLAAYAKKDPKDVKLDPIRSLPNLNWRVTYTGLGRLEMFKKLFKSVTLNHSYQSTFNMGSFTSNVLYTDNERIDPVTGTRFADTVDINGNFIPKYQISTVTISEQFAPLIGIDMKWKNSLQTRIEFKKDRTMSMNVTNTQVTEVRGTELTVGAGYRIPDIELPFKIGKNGKRPVSDVNLRADFSVRDNRTIIRKIVEGVNTPTAGQLGYSLRTSADYKLSNKINLRVFYDWVKNNPVISTAFPTSNINAGFSIRFSLNG